MLKVGFDQISLHDPTRQNWMDTGLRPLPVSVWYPTSSSTQVEAMFLPQDTPLFVMGTVAVASPLSDSLHKFPVVLLSHGTGGTAASLGWLATRLAAMGWIVIGVDHHGNTASETYRPEGFLCWWERPRDLTAAMDILSENGRFAGRLDLNRVSAVGFSLGGYTALATAGAITDMALFQKWGEGRPQGNGPREFPDLAAYIPPLLEKSLVFKRSWNNQSISTLDTRVKSVVALAPAPTVRGFTLDSLRQISVPVTLAVGGADREAPAEDCCIWLHHHVPNATLHLLDRNIGHYIFLCEGTENGKGVEPDVWCDAPGVDRNSIHDAVFQTVTAGLAAAQAA